MCRVVRVSRAQCSVCRCVLSKFVAERINGKTKALRLSIPILIVIIGSILVVVVIIIAVVVVVLIVIIIYK